MTTWTDKAGHRLLVMPADGLNPGRMEISHPDGEEYGSARFWLDGDTGPAELSAAVFAACGQPVPVILERPDVDTSVSTDIGPLGVWLSDGGEVVVSLGTVAKPLGSRAAARKVAALIAAYADASGAGPGDEPDPAEVDALAAVLHEASPTAMGLDGARPAARRILAALPALGWKREASDGD